MSLITDRQPETTTYDLVLAELLDDWASPEELAERIANTLNGRKVGQPATSSRSEGPHTSFAKEV